MIRALGFGLGIVVLLYLLVNAAYLRILGLEGIRAEPAVASASMQAVLGEHAGVVAAVVVIIAALSTLNGTIVTGSRAIEALGHDVPALRALASPPQQAGAPRTALLFQTAWVVMLIGFGALAPDGFAAMIKFTAPVFWLFLLLVGISLFVLRTRQKICAPFQTPFYPWVPLAFCASSAYMLQASILYAGLGGLLGLALLALGLPFSMAMGSTKDG